MRRQSIKAALRRPVVDVQLILIFLVNWLFPPIDGECLWQLVSLTLQVILQTAFSQRQCFILWYRPRWQEVHAELGQRSVHKGSQVRVHLKTKSYTAVQIAQLLNWSLVKCNKLATRSTFQHSWSLTMEPEAQSTPIAFCEDCWADLMIIFAAILIFNDRMWVYRMSATWNLIVSKEIVYIQTVELIFRIAMNVCLFCYYALIKWTFVIVIGRELWLHKVWLSAVVKVCHWIHAFRFYKIFLA